MLKRYWKPALVVLFLGAMTAVLYFEDYYHDYHTVVMQAFTFILIVVAFWLRRYLIPVAVYFAFVHVLFDGLLIGEFPAAAVRESLLQFVFVGVLYVVLDQRDKSRVRLKRYIDASRIATWEWDLRTNVKTYNERWAAMLGYRLDELRPITNETWLRLAHPDDAVSSQKAVDAVLAGETEFFEHKSRLRHKDGHWVWILDRGNVVQRTRRGKPTVMSGTHTDITLEMTLAERLHQQNAKFVRLVASAPDIIYELDLEQRHTAIYGKWMKDEGVTPSQFLGKTARDVFGETAAKPHEEAFARVLAGEGVVYDWHIAGTAGERFFQTSLSPILGTDGEVAGAVGVGRDVTALKLAERRLLHSHDLMKYVIEHSNSAIAVHDRDLRYLFVSDNYKKQYHVLDRDLIGKHHYDVFPDLPEKWRAVHRRCLGGEVLSADRDRYDRADGTVDYTRWECRPWFEDDGTVGGIVIYTEVITEQVKMEQELVRRADELTLQKRRAEATLLSIGDGVVSTGHDGRIAAFNVVAEKLTGWTAAEAIGRRFDEVFALVKEASGEPAVDPVRRVVESGRRFELENHTILVAKDGSRYYVEDSAAPIIDVDGSLSGVVLVFRDVTEKNFKQREIEYLSIHDFMTGLYNRRHFVERLAAMDNENHYPLGVVMSDFNGLKILNDAFGHDLGDEALKKIAHILERVAPTSAVIARIGGDEFAAILPNASEVEIAAFSDALRTAVAGEHVNNVPLSLAVGYAIKDATSASIDEVLKLAENDMYAHKISEGSSVRNRAIQAILKTLTDKYAKEKVHSERVSRLCGAIGRALSLRSEEQRELEMAGLYHDIGKIAIPDEILNKPGRLEPAEFDVMKKHTEIGYQILRAADEYSDLAEYALSHQERWDGKGYPRGIAGTAIPLFSRIISIADAYEAMTADRPYRMSLSKAEAVERMREGRGTQFDPELDDLFLNVVLPGGDF
ncbi:MAG: PAS domain-containing protein [Candidatus Izemoplasmatales bacterium]